MAKPELKNASWERAEPRVPPPLYKNTIVLCSDSDWFSLWLESYEDVLFSDGDPHSVIQLKVGLRDRVIVHRCRLAESPSPQSASWYLSKYLNVPEIVRFQQAVLKYAVRDIRSRRQPSITTRCYAMRLIFEGLKTLQLAHGTQEPTDVTSPESLIDTYLRSFTDTSYPRPVFNAVRQQPVQYQYVRDSPSLLDWREYERYEAEGFHGYFPKPFWVLQEEQTVLSDATRNTELGTTRNSDTRDLQPVVPISRLRKAFVWHPEILDEVDQLRKENAAKAKSARPPQPSGAAPQPSPSSSSTAPSLTQPTGTSHRELERVTCYGFRGDTREPLTVKAHGGFRCKYVRKIIADPTISSLANRVDTTLKEGASETYFNLLLGLGVLDLDAYTKGDKPIARDFGAYVSTTLSLAIAKCFSNDWHRSIDLKNPGRANFKSQNFCYAMRVNNGFFLPSKGETAVARRLIHEFANFAEQEVAVLGGIEWEEVTAFRLCFSRREGQLLAGPVWIRRRLLENDWKAFSELHALLSGRSQGMHEGIIKSYGVPPWAARLQTFPKRADVNSE